MTENQILAEFYKTKVKMENPIGISVDITKLSFSQSSIRFRATQCFVCRLMQIFLKRYRSTEKSYLVALYIIAL